MSDLKELIEQEIDQYFEWPTADKSHVTTGSAKLFAEHVARLYADHIADARKKAGRPQIREVFLRNGAVIPADRDDLPDWVYESVFELLDSVIQQAGPAIQYVAPDVQGEPVAWSGWGCQYPGKMPRLYGERRIAELNCDWENGDQVLHFTAAPQSAEQQPALIKYQPCGCVICTCEHETQCQGCGAKHCGTHPVGQIPGPVYQQPEAAQLVEALEWLRGAINATPENDKVQAGTWISTKHPRIKQIDAILAAHRKQGSEAPVSPAARFPDCEMECGAYGSYCRCADESKEPSHDNQ